MKTKSARVCEGSGQGGSYQTPNLPVFWESPGLARGKITKCSHLVPPKNKEVELDIPT